MNLAALLESYSVMPSEHWENDDGPDGWYAVCNDDDGIIAYFLTEASALRFRLNEINRILNP